MIVVAALYCFFPFNDYREQGALLKNLCKKEGLKGTLILAEEGINGTVAGSPEGIGQLKAFLFADPRRSSMEYKESVTDKSPFFRMKVHFKAEIVTMGIPHIHPEKDKGEYVDPQEWNALISDPTVFVFDARNSYETKVGRFKEAKDPGIENFRDLPSYIDTQLDPKKHTRIATYCTGGIRCEKATAYLKAQGFEEVYHLKGGILKYLETIPSKESLWEGECFVFDQRIGVEHEVKKGAYVQCHGCRMPLSPEERVAPFYEEGISCLYCYETLTDQKRQRRQERQKQIALAKSRNQAHIGVSRSS
jgi:UPF0176 protein